MTKYIKFDELSLGDMYVFNPDGDCIHHNTSVLVYNIIINIDQIKSTYTFYQSIFHKTKSNTNWELVEIAIRQISGDLIITEKINVH